VFEFYPGRNALVQQEINAAARRQVRLPLLRGGRVSRRAFANAGTALWTPEAQAWSLGKHATKKEAISIEVKTAGPGE
jgi:hypothetical protein